MNDIPHALPHLYWSSNIAIISECFSFPFLRLKQFLLKVDSCNMFLMVLAQ